jgi:hypothetical protein
MFQNDSFNWAVASLLYLTTLCGLCPVNETLSAGMTHSLVA